MAYEGGSSQGKSKKKKKKKKRGSDKTAQEDYAARPDRLSLKKENH